MTPVADRVRTRYPYRMKDLCELTGLSRQAIHSYVQQGLVPPGKKTGRNMAYYGQEHVERLLLVRRLQHERFLPLKAIKALIADETEHLAPEQRQMLRELKTHLTDRELGAGHAMASPGAAGLAPGDASGVVSAVASIDATALAARHGVALSDIRRMAEIGLLALAGTGQRARIAASDAWMVELWSQIRGLGFTEDLGFGVDDLAMYEEAMSALFAREKSMMLDRLGDQPPARVAAMLQAALPLIHTFLARYHAAQVRNFFAAIE